MADKLTTGQAVGIGIGVGVGFTGLAVTIFEVLKSFTLRVHLANCVSGLQQSVYVILYKAEYSNSTITYIEKYRTGVNVNNCIATITGIKQDYYLMVMVNNLNQIIDRRFITVMSNINIDI